MQPAVWAIKFFVRINPEILPERCPIVHTLSGVYGDWTALEMACDVDAPLKVINYLMEATHHVSDEVTNWGGSILMHQRRRSIYVVKSYFGKCNWPRCEFLYHDYKPNGNIE